MNNEYNSLEHGYNILVIENDTAYINLLTQLLSVTMPDNSKVKISSNLEMAYEQLATYHFDLVILSLTVSPEPEFNAFLSFKNICKDVPIIALSNKFNSELALKIIRNGGFECLFKEINEKQFLLELQIAIERTYLLQHKLKLANFSEWNPYPVIALNSEGKVVYANLIARTQFSEIMTQELKHPLLSGLEKIIFQLKPKKMGDIAVFNREINLNKKHYEQQVFGFFHSYIYIYIIDTTERDMLRAQALLADKLATIGMLASGIAHEINNPITWILSNLNFLQEYATSLMSYVASPKNEDSQKIKELLEKILELSNDSLKGMECVRGIVGDLKAFARVDEKSEMTVDIHDILNSVINMASREFKYRARIKKDYMANLPLFLGNGGKLHQVFLNLVVNAAQAISEGNADINHVTITTRFENSRIRVDISDTGQGIPPENLNRIFEPFFTTKPAGRGTGLGLSISQEIIKSLNGEIVVKSKINLGTTFSIFLPAITEKTLQKSIVNTRPPATKNQRVLVVDDDPTLLKTLKYILDKHHKVVAAQGGRAAIDEIKKTGMDFDIIITDLNMPEVSGMDLYKYVAANHPGHEHKVVFITSGIDTAWLKEFLTDKPNILLEKPFMPRELLHTVDEVAVNSH